MTDSKKRITRNKHNISETKTRLEESKYWLNKINENYFHYRKCTYYLNAFISSSRSILWIMKKEYIHVPGWETWYDSKRFSKKEEVFLKKINDLRIRVQKKGSIRPNFQMKVQILNTSIKLENKLKEWLGKKVKWVISVEKSTIGQDPNVAKNNASFIGKIIDFKGIVSEFPGKDILLICRKYYALLEPLVLECEKKFLKKLCRSKK